MPLVGFLVVVMCASVCNADLFFHSGSWKPLECVGDCGATLPRRLYLANCATTYDTANSLASSTDTLVSGPETPEECKAACDNSFTCVGYHVESVDPLKCRIYYNPSGASTPVVTSSGPLKRRAAVGTVIFDATTVSLGSPKDFLLYVPAGVEVTQVLFGGTPKDTGTLRGPSDFRLRLDVSEVVNSIVLTLSSTGGALCVSAPVLLTPYSTSEKNRSGTSHLGELVITVLMFLSIPISIVLAIRRHNRMKRKKD